MILRRTTFALAALALAACGKPHEASPAADAGAPVAGGTVDAAGVVTAAPEHMTTVLPAIPGAGGSAASDAPFDPGSPRGAVDVLKVYYSMVGAKRYGDARIWWDEGAPSEPANDAALAASFDRYDTYAAQVGQPSAPQGAAGSTHLTVPVVIHARLKSGGEVTEQATVQLHRINDTPGASGHQVSWRIDRIDSAAAR